MCAGHSLGEYSAHVAAGTLAFADAVRTVRNRGRYMQEAVPVGVGAMAAILGMPVDKVSEIAAEAAQGEVCQAANINSPEQIVISGHAGAVERAIKLATERGAKKAVQPAGQRTFPLLADATGAGSSGARPGRAEFSESVVSGGLQCRCGAWSLPREAAREALIRQVTGTVRWEPSVRLLIDKGASLFIEVGPGKVLWGSDAADRPLEDLRDGGR